MDQIEAISAKLEIIEEHMAWLIRPEERFRVGQRVEWSAKGLKSGFPTRKKSKKGTVKAINSFSIVVKLDGRTRNETYHHAFFNPVIGQKLF